MASKQKPEVRQIAVGDLKKHPDNEDLRYIKKDEFEDLKSSLLVEVSTGYFEARPCIISVRTGENIILAGNQRYEAAKSLGWDTVPCIILPNLTEEEEIRILVKDNGSFGKWNHDNLSAIFEVEELKEFGVDIPNVDFKEISNFFDDIGSGGSVEIEKPSGIDDSGSEASKNTITLEYTEEEFQEVTEALLKISDVFEDAVMKLIKGQA